MTTLHELLGKSTPLPWRMCAPYYAALTSAAGGGLVTTGILAEFTDPDAQPKDIKLHNALLAAHAVNVLPELLAALELAEPAVEYHHAREGCPVTLQAVRAALRKARHINPPPAFRRRPKKKGTIP